MEDRVAEYQKTQRLQACIFVLGLIQWNYSEKLEVSYAVVQCDGSCLLCTPIESRHVLLASIGLFPSRIIWMHEVLNSWIFQGAVPGCREGGSFFGYPTYVGTTYVRQSNHICYGTALTMENVD